jgi:hypothetical protein
MRHPLRDAIAPLLLLSALTLVLVLRHGPLLDTPGGTAAPRPLPPSASQAFELGVATDALARNSFKPWEPEDLRSVNAFEHAVGRHADVVMFYADWEHATFSAAQLRAIADRGSVPEITWEPWDSNHGLGKAQPKYRLSQIIEGRFDARVRDWADGLAKYQKPVRLRFAQEMNGFWYPWSETANGNHRGEFVRAWRHVHDIFAAAGARNVQWVWTPVSGAPADYFPGEGYVDRLGLTCLNGGPRLFADGWRSLERICGRSVAALHALAPGLPIELAELASSEDGGSKAAWIRDAGKFLRAHPEIATVVWFNLDKETDWRIQSSAASERSAAIALGETAPR